MSVLMVYEVLEKLKNTKSKKEKIGILKANVNWAIQDIFKGTLDDTLVWNLPPGAPPYTASDPHNTPSSFLRRNVQLKYFIKGGVGDNMPSWKRESIFIQLLEAIHPEDAKCVIDMINKKPIPGVTKALIKEVYPNLIVK